MVGERAVENGKDRWKMGIVGTRCGKWERGVEKGTSGGLVEETFSKTQYVL